MDKFIPISKKTKKEQKAYYASQRGIWEFSPVTRSVPSKKTYNRKKAKQAERSSRYQRINDICCFLFALKIIYLIDVYTRNRYNHYMIRSFRDKETEKVYYQVFSKKLPQNIQRIALRKLIMIDNARCLEDLRVPPANHLEALQGNMVGQYSIRINDQYRICFRTDGADFYDVGIVDYH